MSPTAERLRQEILALPTEERFALIEAIIEPRETVPLGLHPSWEAELDRRMQSFRDGTAKLYSEEEVNRELEEILNRP